MTQPEALRLAEKLEQGYVAHTTVLYPAAAELRRLHESNQELLVALKEARKIIRASSSRNLVKDWDVRTTAAIAKGETK
jgi:hypothetical protein